MFAFEEIYNKNELWNKRPMGITTEESNLESNEIGLRFRKTKKCIDKVKILDTYIVLFDRM